MLRRMCEYEPMSEIEIITDDGGWSRKCSYEKLRIGAKTLMDGVSLSVITSGHDVAPDLRHR